jgi:hypothetical protein
MGKPFQIPQPDKPESVSSEQNYDKHGKDGGNTKDKRYLDNPPCAAAGSGVHKQRDDGFTGSEYENCKQYPGSYISGVHMIMLIQVGMFMYMDTSIHMAVNMPVRLFPVKPVKTPDGVAGAEQYKKPGGYITPETFNTFQP